MDTNDAGPQFLRHILARTPGKIGCRGGICQNDICFCIADEALNSFQFPQICENGNVSGTVVGYRVCRELADQFIRW